MTIDNENDLIAQRRQDLKEMRKTGNAYSNKFKRDSLSSDLHAEYESKSKEELENASIKVSIAGRMMSRRIMGKASFAHIQDMTGKIQLYVRRDDLSDGIYNEGFKKWDIGDIVGAIGTVMKTNKGELSIHVNSIELLTKSLQPLPEKYHGLTDQELRYRQRYVDLIMNEQTREIFKIRSKVVEFLRS
ncbi:MAG: lysine--tRNA ligase, partial [Legionellales bacterium]|nr:lysine--tRNA ligase [Legionellales bacterium]